MNNEDLLKMIIELSHRINMLEIENKNLKRDIEDLKGVNKKYKNPYSMEELKEIRMKNTIHEPSRGY